jgi:hypothetical protein
MGTDKRGRLATGLGAPALAAAVGTGTVACGDRIALGAWEFVVHGVSDPLEPTNEFSTPCPGNRWGGVDLEITNKGSRAERLSGLLSVELKDSDNRTHSRAITSIEGRNPPDGSFSPGESRRGAVDFEVPRSARGLKLSVSPDPLDAGKATVVLGD